MPEFASNTTPWFATCPKGVESLLLAELRALGAADVRETVAGVHFSGPWAMAYRACLWSRLANRILWPLAKVPAGDADTLYRELLRIEWGDLFAAEKTIAVTFTGENRGIRNTQFGAQRVKDALVDWFSQRAGARPSVDRKGAQVRINVRLVRDVAHVAIDLSGTSLHRRGYRRGTGPAPLKENLAAAVLLRADWPGMAARGGALLDPMCGSATLLIEGAMMAADIAPALGRDQFGFEHLCAHDPQQWRAIYSDAQGRAERGKAAQLPPICGYDEDAKVVRKAQENIAQAGLRHVVRVSHKPLSALVRPSHADFSRGLIASNPPYGERLGDVETLVPVYRQLGERMSSEFQGWSAALLTSELALGKAVGLRSHKRYALFNGAIAAHLLLFELQNNVFREAVAANSDGPSAALSDGAQMVANRVRKNRKRLASWVKREQVDCYRVYDADMPEYAVAVDIYGDNVHVAEYRAPKGVDPAAAQRRLEDVKAALPDALGVPAERIVYKQRSRQKGAQQYRKRDDQGALNLVREGQARLLVNLHDYLDTGLFLDHRPLRLRIAEEARGKHFLNLFCYTGAATVHAAMGGAGSTTSVDTSNTYLAWLGKNLSQNGYVCETVDGRAEPSAAPVAGSHRAVRGDCLAWLQGGQSAYDLILLDPPSFSNSKSRTESFDVQRDHLALLDATMARLSQGGTLYFSNNRRDFQLDAAVGERYRCEDISAQTIPPDFQRNTKIHRCWRLMHRD